MTTTAPPPAPGGDYPLAGQPPLTASSLASTGGDKLQRKEVLTMPRMRSEEATLKAIGATVRTYREDRGLSQADLATLAELDRSYLSGLENGKRNPSIGVLWKTAKVLRVTVSDLTAGV
ncbi:helix-turn-helix domain-containing protein [[Mycobacterium] nativiensis]|uniref:Helix-turn-helix transcriptional regulator n=1 Tax=[Mycobacterium] nativiensis TaxID=2855503 RepID=A0ABU5XUU2_9MYCO|nr:helix-turn-helix transcriptional regulator [Mycolicibacter sp. MYC340]MEB3031757.1 helix-turn-helix transcriptional regulator [Mycolicibacter sp. MYC340]